MTQISELGGRERLRLVRQLEGARRLYGSLKVEEAHAWAAYYRAVDEAEDGPKAPWGGMPPETAENLRRLYAWARAKEEERIRAGHFVDLLSDAILREEVPENMEDYRDLFTPMVAQLEAV